jgi:hypothetical protein
LTAAQIKNDCPVLVQDLGKRIAALYDKMVKCEGKVEQHKIAIRQMLTQAKGACDEGGFTAFRERFCPKLGKTRAHELLQIASGKKTIEDVRAATARRMKKHRAAKKTAVEQKPKPSVTVTDPDPAVIAEKHKASDPPEANGKIAAEAKPSLGSPSQEPSLRSPRRRPSARSPPSRKPILRWPSRKPSLRSPSQEPSLRSRKPRPK